MPRQKSNRWEVYGYGVLCRKFTALAYCRTKRDATALLAKWRRLGYNRPACVRRREG